MKKIEDVISKWKEINENSIKVLSNKGMTYGDFLKYYLTKVNEMLEDALQQPEEQVRKRSSPRYIEKGD